MADVVLSVLAHRVGVPLAQPAVDDKTNELPVAVEVLRQLGLQGRIVPLDALLPQRQSAQQSVAAGGDYGMVVKENQPQLCEDRQTVLALAPMAGERRTTAATVDLGHGRIAQRGLQTTNLLAGDSAWPGGAQVWRRERQVILTKPGEGREAGGGVTSLPPEGAAAARFLAVGRGHWSIADRSHWVREVTFDAERSPVRCGHIPQGMAALRTTVVGLRRWAGSTNRATACRRFAAQPQAALHLIGMALEN